MRKQLYEGLLREEQSKFNKSVTSSVDLPRISCHLF